MSFSGRLRHAGTVRSPALAAAALVALFATCGGSTHAATGARTVVRAGAGPADPPPKPLAARPAGSLPAALQDAAFAASGDAVVLLGGLSAADTSTSNIWVLRGSAAAARGRLPGALHDAAAVTLGSSVYVFGGGNAVGQLDSITRVDAATGAASSAGRLPTASSDSTAAALGGTAYVVGGYTGKRWLDTILAWRPGSAPRVAARLPTPLRYAAVAVADGQLVIAGGSTPAGSASREVLAFDPASGRVSRIGLLPAPTTHAAAATLNDTVYVIGGRGARAGTPVSTIVSVDPSKRRVRVAGALRAALSDLAAVGLQGRIVVAGGRGAQGAQAGIFELVPSGKPVRATAAAAPPLLDPHDVYAADRPNRLTGAALRALPRVYVPNSQSGTVDVIDPRTYKVVDHFAVGALPQHVTPSYDLRTLYVDNDLGNTLTPLDPRTGKPAGAPIPVEDPYNLYFTPDGRYAISVAERLHRLDFRDAHTLRLVHSLSVDCRGIDHMDFSADGRYALGSCEFSNQIVRLDVAAQRIVGTIHLGAYSGMPQDVKLSPDGRIFYVADMLNNGVWEISSGRLKVIAFLKTGRGAHGLYPSRDSRYLYVSNRAEGTISVVSFRTRRVVQKWTIGGSPDMGGVSADGKVLWLSGRYDRVVYAISTRTGRLLARIPVGAGPHGLCVWPQPGRYSLGHTGILR
jgi:YVTN family beta-propeller protein